MHDIRPKRQRRISRVGAAFVWILCAAWVCGACGTPSAPDASAQDPDAHVDDHDASGDDAGNRDAGNRDAGNQDAGNQDAQTGMPWRSAFYPVDWEPSVRDDAGRFLHDFSYAGYHGGRSDVGSRIRSNEIDVVRDHGADPSGARDATDAIQAAIDAAAAQDGALIHIPAGLYRIDGSLSITHDHIVLRGAGPEDTRLYFTRHADRAYQAHLQFRGATIPSLETRLRADAETQTTRIQVVDTTGFEVGDSISLGWTITDEFIETHGMSGTWEAFNGQWQPFFWRTITAIDREARELQIDVPLRYPARQRDAASVRQHPGLLRECGIESLGLSNAVAWDDAWAQNQVHVLGFDGVQDCWVREVHSFASPIAPTDGPGATHHLQSSGILVKRAMRMTVQDSRMAMAQNRGSGGNGYLFEVRQSSEVLFRDCVARAGRHNFIQNWGFGTSGVVWLRVHSSDGLAQPSRDIPFGTPGYSEFHHSLATANLIDNSTFEDGWSAINRGNYSSGAGHTATENVLWNTRGSGLIRSAQYGWGYVIGTAPETTVMTSPSGVAARGTAPTDVTEGLGRADTLQPTSLYEDQLRRRLGP